MTDDVTPEQKTPAARRPSPGAGAASRARRIGGRPLPGPRPAPRPAAQEQAQEQAKELAQGQVKELEPPVGSVPPAASASAPWHTGRVRWLPAGAFGVVVVALLAFIGLALWDVWGGGGPDRAAQRGQVLAAAKTCMATMNTYDYRKLDEAERNGLACTTGKLTGQYKQAMEQLIKPQAAKVQFSQTAQVNKAGIESVSADGRQWTVLIFGQLSTTNSQTGTKTPTLSIFSARVVMQHVGGQWLVANYQYAPAD